MAKKQFYGIKYPFENKSERNYYVDLNETVSEKMASDILHVVFTPKGQRYRMPEFGTNLIQYLFEPNDDETWDKIVGEVNEQVARYVPNANIDDIEILQDEENENSVYAKITFSVIKGNLTDTNQLTVKLV